MAKWKAAICPECGGLMACICLENPAYLNWDKYVQEVLVGWRKLGGIIQAVSEQWVLSNDKPCQCAAPNYNATMAFSDKGKITITEQEDGKEKITEAVFKGKNWHWKDRGGDHA